MAITTLQDEAIEKSTFGIQGDFTDEDGDAVTPNEDTVKWTLTDDDGTVINDREQEAVASDSTVVITLSGDDLALYETEQESVTVYRYFLVEYEFDSDLGTDLPGKDECRFTVRNLKYVT